MCRAVCLKTPKGREGRAVMTTTVPATARSRPFTSCRTWFSSSFRNGLGFRAPPPHVPPALLHAVPAGAGAGARVDAHARSVTDLRGVPPPAHTHGRAGRAGRGASRAQVPAAAERGVLRRPGDASAGLGGAGRRRAGQEARSRATSERPHVPGDPQPLRPPVPERRGDTCWPWAAGAATWLRAQGPSSVKVVANSQRERLDLSKNFPALHTVCVCV